MFDPARDEDPGNQRFWARTLRTGVVALGLGMVALPSLMGFRVSNAEGAAKDCVAIVHAWDAAPPPPGEARFVDAAPRAACVPESRHRLVLSSVGGVAVLGTAFLVTIVSRRRRTSVGVEPVAAFEFAAPAAVDIPPSIAAAFRGASTLPAHSDRFRVPERETAAP